MCHTYVVLVWLFLRYEESAANPDTCEALNDNFWHGNNCFRHICDLVIIVSPAKQGWHIGIMTLWRRGRRLRLHTFGFRSITIEWMHQFHSNITERSNIIKCRSRSIKGVIRKILTELWPFILLRFWLNFQFVVSDQLLLKGCNNFFQILRNGKAW